jgi:hypothetical protein
MDVIDILMYILYIVLPVCAAVGTLWYVNYRNDSAGPLLIRARRWFDQYGDELKARSPAKYNSLKNLLEAVESANAESEPVTDFVKIVYAIWSMCLEGEKILNGAYGDTFEPDEEEVKEG